MRKEKTIKSPTINEIFIWLKKNAPMFYSDYRFFVLNQIDTLNLKKLPIEFLDFARLMVMPIYDFIWFSHLDGDFQIKYTRLTYDDKYPIKDDKYPIKALRLNKKDYKKYKKIYEKKIYFHNLKLTI